MCIYINNYIYVYTYTGSCTTIPHKVICEAIFKSVGVIYEVPEKMMDGITGLSGSGPAYVFLFIEALADGAVRMGIPRNIALQLAAQTVKGAATMCLESGLHPGVLKDQVYI
jgi:pyrroline-5-carboxylate reductase